MTASTSVVDAFFGTLDFDPDPFQRAALASLEAGRTVVVTAPTGAGKTVIADGGIAIARSKARRAFYTTPIKALSNQKFADLRAVHGDHAVGLLTGDNVINGDASIVVMTTEVLRNMIYEESHALDNLGMVILDEVHYLADRERGSVWEEVVIHLDQSVQLACLSATIANADEFTAWVRERRGPTDLIVEHVRPVPLTSMYAWRDRHKEGSVHALPVFARNGRPNPTIAKLIDRSRGRHRRFSTPRRTDVVEYLRDEGKLPAIYFVFSRKGCDTTARSLAAAQLGLTTADEREAIEAIVEPHVAPVSPQDLEVLGYRGWLSMLRAGVGAHHAGLVPAFKEAVEELFLSGLLKVVVATETLALGINMPAKTVVIESLSKFNGESHELLQPSDYTQLTGRAGRRGIDTEGTAIVLHSSYVPFERVSGIAAAGSNPLRSSFTPTYNMTVNLMARYGKKEALSLLEASFANYAEKQRHEALEQNLEARRGDVATYRRAARCELGDITTLNDDGATPKRPSANTELLEPGSVLRISGETRVVLGRSWGGGQPQLSLTDRNGARIRLRTRELPLGTKVIGEMSLPTPVVSSDIRYRKEVGGMLDTFVPESEGTPLFASGVFNPVLDCPDLSVHLEWLDRAKRAERDVRRLERRVGREQEHSVVTDFRALRRVLADLGYVEGWSVTDLGEQLRTIYNEFDLVLAETIRSGDLDGLDPPTMAAVLSVFTYEARGGDESSVPQLSGASEPIGRILERWETISELEARHGVEPRRQPDYGLVDVIHGWASGHPLADLFEDEDLRAGDFVRSARQLLDLMRRIRDSYALVAEPIGLAIREIDRGIVSTEVMM